MYKVYGPPPQFIVSCAEYNLNGRLFESLQHQAIAIYNLPSEFSWTVLNSRFRHIPHPIGL